MHWDGPSNFSIVRGTPKSLQTAGIRSKFRARGAHRDKVIEVVIDHCHPPLEHCPLQRIGNCRENFRGRPEAGWHGPINVARPVPLYSQQGGPEQVDKRI